MNTRRPLEAKLEPSPTPAYLGGGDPPNLLAKHNFLVLTGPSALGITH